MISSYQKYLELYFPNKISNGVKHSKEVRAKLSLFETFLSAGSEFRPGPTLLELAFEFRRCVVMSLLFPLELLGTAPLLVGHVLGCAVGAVIFLVLKYHQIKTSLPIAPFSSNSNQGSNRDNIERN